MAKNGKTKTTSGRIKHPRSVTERHKIIGDRIRAARIAIQMSQQELGNQLGISFQQIQKYEKGKNRVDVDRMIQICKLLNMKMEDLIGRVDIKPNSKQQQIEKLMATREGHQVIEAMVELSPAQRQVVVDIARKLITT